MPSKRPSSHAMDEAAAAAARLDAAAPRAKSRSSRSRARARDRRRSPNPNPSATSSRRPPPPPASAPRKSDRKPKPRAFPDSTTLAAAAAAASSASATRGAGAAQKLWSDADEVALLTGAAAFKEKSGVAPRLPDMGELYEFLRDSIAPHLDRAKVYYKLKRLKSKFQHTAPSATSTPHDRLVRDLSADLWGAELAHPAPEDGEPPLEEDDAEGEEAEGVNALQLHKRGDVDEPEPGSRLPIVREVLGEYWRSNGQSGVYLEKGLSQVEPEEAGVVEAKWRRHLEADMRMRMRWHDLGKEVYGLLMDAIKGLGP